MSGDLTWFDLADGWTVTGPGDPVSATARAELEAALESALGTPAGNGAGPAVRFELAHDGGTGDGFTVAAGDGAASVRGDSPRGLLFGVFDLLEQAGWRWAGPSDVHGRAPDSGRLVLPAAPVRSRPALAERALIIGSPIALADADGWIAWAARNKLGTLFVHTDPPTGGLGGAVPWTEWEASRTTVRDAAARYGLDLELGGHNMAALLPRDRFATDPEWFRWSDGKRTPDHNLCPTHPGALAAVRASAAAWFRDNPGMAVYHLWPDDLPGGGWCGCEACARLTPADQSLTVTNVIADVLASIDPDATLTHLAYHDASAVPTVVPRPNVALLWAPRRRCYAHGFADPACPVNGPTAGGFAELAGWFADHGARPARVFEYYLDAILFKALVPPMPTVIARDLADYRAAGAGSVGALLVGPRSYLAPPVNAWLFARTAWDTTAEPGGVVDDAVTGRGLPGDGPGTDFLRAQERVGAAAIGLRPAQVENTQTFAGLLEDPLTYMIEHGLADSEDPEPLPAAALAEMVTGLDTAIADLAASVAALGAAPSAERREADLLLRWAGFARQRAALHLALADGAATAGLRGALERVLAAWATVLEWCAANLSKDDAFGTERLLWLFWRVPLYRFELDHVVGDDEAAAGRVRAQRDGDVARVLMGVEL